MLKVAPLVPGIFSYRLNKLGTRMNSRIEAMVEQAKSLTPEELVALLDALGELASPPNADWQAAWAKECEDRLVAYQQGLIDAEDFDSVMSRLRQDYLNQ